MVITAQLDAMENSGDFTTRKRYLIKLQIIVRLDDVINDDNVS